MISEKEIEHIVKLARLKLTEKEMEKMKKEIPPILDYFQKLKEVDISKIEPSYHSVPIENVMRTDKVKSSEPEVRKKIIEQAPESENKYFKVKPIL